MHSNTLFTTSKYSELSIPVHSKSKVHSIERRILIQSFGAIISQFMLHRVLSICTHELKKNKQGSRTNRESEATESSDAFKNTDNKIFLKVNVGLSKYLK